MDKFAEDALKILKTRVDGIEYASVDNIVNLLVQSSTQPQAFEIIKSTRSIWDRVYIYAYILHVLNEELKPNNKGVRPKFLHCFQALHKSDAELITAIGSESSTDFSYFHLEENKNFLEDILAKMKESSDLNQIRIIARLAVASKPRFFSIGYLIDQLKFLYWGQESDEVPAETKKGIITFSTGKINLILAVRRNDFTQIIG